MQHVTRREGLLIALLPLLLLIPGLTAKCAGPAYAQTVEERHITPVAEPPGTDLQMGVMYHEPQTLQQKRYREAFTPVMAALQASGAPHRAKQPIFAILVNADKAADAKDFEGATALVKVAEAEVKKLK